MDQDLIELSNQVILVHVWFDKERSEGLLAELTELANTAGLEVMAQVLASRSKPDARYYVGSGKVEEIKSALTEHGGSCVIFNHPLSPSQTRNLEKALQCRVIDRTGLILDIFAQRAQTFEGKLQVELAQLSYLSTRLVRGWTHLERQKGGIGLRGPGETQLEVDRRLIRNRIAMIKKRLAKVRSQRALARRTRQKAQVSSISLVGYTNAGKSTLFNALTQSDAYVADQLFATLDPTRRQIKIKGLGPIVLIDTVGFIRALPHDLVDAFRATLEETIEADLLLHVVDFSDEAHLEHIESVREVLGELGIHRQPILEVYNKIDQQSGLEPRIDRDANGLPIRVWLSAGHRLGFELLDMALAEHLQQVMVSGMVRLGNIQGALRSKLYELNCVEDEVGLPEGGWELSVCIQRVRLEKLCKKYQINIGDILVE